MALSIASFVCAYTNFWEGAVWTMDKKADNDGLIWVVVVWILFILFIGYTGTFPDNVVAGAFLSLR